MKKVSIIIPLYNLEKLIGKCIASALAQDLSPEEYEILVIDDGSTDGSLAAAEKAAQGHPNVHVYTKPNEGLSRTRNYGTDRAAGRYVMYLDADDYLEPNVLGRLVETMECGGLDMLCFEIAGIDENGNDVPLWSDGISAGNGSDVQRGVDFLQRDRFLPMVYAYLYSREMLDANSLRMTPIWHEDEEFTPRALYYARRIQYLPVRVYNYLQRSDSLRPRTRNEKPDLFRLPHRGGRPLRRPSDAPACGQDHEPGMQTDRGEATRQRPRNAPGSPPARHHAARIPPPGLPAFPDKPPAEPVRSLL